ncbi:MAG: hypothetical protein P8X96_12165 [Desulfobacteraceae bacterium]|jgi:hypothetical protein
MRRILAQIFLVLMMAMGSVHAQDKAVPPQPPKPSPEDLEIIAIMEVLKLMDLTREMDMVKEMEYLVEENQNERTTD